MEEKRFDEWNELKKKLHNSSKIPTFREGEIWWCGLGQNVGTEMNGKNEKYSRPILILRKLSKYNFLGVPLTSQKHEGTWWVEFSFLNKNQYATLNQIRIIDSRRLYTKMGQVPNSDLALVREGFRRLYC